MKALNYYLLERIFSNSKYIAVTMEMMDLIINENVVDTNLPKTEATSTTRVLMKRKIYSPPRTLA